jgi:CheY-like chemotaxis protein/glycine cleavage system H lipoate-binding protein
MQAQARILVVDDELPVCRSVSAALEEEYLVDTALSAEEAIRKGGETDYDIVITDLMMPGLSGMDLIKQLAVARPNTKVVMITGYPSIKSAVESIRQGAFDFLPKPFTPGELRSVVSRALESRRYHEGLRGGGVDAPVSAPAGVYRIPENSWALVLDDGNVKVGVDHGFVRAIQAIDSLDLPGEGEMRYQGEACVRIRDTRNFVHKVWTPVSGRIVAVNTALMTDPTPLVRDPYGAGWLVVLAPTNLAGELPRLSASKSD